jgi:preprotein translocase subunit SecG
LIGRPLAPKCFQSRGNHPLQVLVNILLVVNIFVCVALVAVVLLQRSEGGALGMGGGGPGNFMTAAGAGDLLTRITWILAFVFFFLSITMTVLTGRLHGGVGSLVDHLNVNSLTLTAPPSKTPLQPAAPATTGPAAPAPSLQAPAPQPQAPTKDPLAAFVAPTVQSQVAPAPAASAPPARTPAPAKK